ncbi:MAG: hypothetical protein RJAPGHWK_000300 [Candidatus Fervidibacter sp.]
MVLWEHPAERYLVLACLAVIAVSLSAIALKRWTEPPLVLQSPPNPPSSPPPRLKVHVKGAVRKPGVYALPFGSRVEEAVRLAQATPDADLDALNLAAFLEGGQEILVPRKGRSEKARLSPSSLALAPSLPPPPRSRAERAKTPAKIVHLNTATEADLMSLPGIGPVLAKRIVEYRRQIGGFKSVEQLLEVKGIGPKKLERLRPYVRL